MPSLPSHALLLAGAALAAAQSAAPPPVETLTATKSGALPVLPPNFTGVPTLEGAIIEQAPANASYVPLGGAAQVQSNQAAATYMATFPATAFDALTGTTISGTVQAASMEGGEGVMFTVQLSNLPDQAKYGPLLYHIHDMPVPSDGNCTATMGHFDPTNAGEYYMCDTAKPENCQAGDLAGKHGKINTPNTFTASYSEKYLSTDPSSMYFFGSKSVVIHSANTTRLTCANFMMGSGSGSSSSGGNGTSSGSGAGSGSSNTTGPATGSPSVVTGSASKAAACGAVAGLMAAVAFFL